jgi:hypothetical protein
MRDIRGARFGFAQDHASRDRNRGPLPNRLSVAASLAAVLAATTPAIADTAPASVGVAIPKIETEAPTSLDVTAKRVSFFSDRYIVTADGNVRVRLSDGTIVRGETFSMDLKLNRYLVAGDVRLDGNEVHEVGAAFAGYPDLERSYFLPATGTPDRWTYFGLDWAHPHPGREQPGDAFYFPDLGRERPYVVAKGATIVPKTNVTFDQDAVRAIGSVYIPTPRYVITFSPNPNWAQNGFFGARFDIAEPFNGSAHSISALHIRNDAVNGTYLAFDQHFVWDRDWIVASIDPLTQETRQYNLIGMKQVSPMVQARVFEQITEGQPGGPIQRPISASSYTNIQLNAGLRRSGLGFNLDQYNWSLLGIDNVAYDMQFFKLQLEHPVNMSLSWTGFENNIGRSGLLKFRLRSGIGYAHDQFGEGLYPTYNPGPEDVWYHYVGGTVYTPSIKLGKFSLTSHFDKQRMWFSLPHHVDQTDVGTSLSRAYAFNKVQTYLAYDVATTGDYWGSRQLSEYPPLPDTFVSPYGGTFTGLAAYRGFTVARTASLGFVYTPTQYFGLNLQLLKQNNFPEPVAGYFGQPPWQVFGDVHLRISRQLQVDISRAYYFNFANLRWTPQFGIQFGP